VDFDRVSKYLDGALIFGIKPSLVRIKKILELMGHPHRETEHIQIVGTNGKTSTAIMLASILKSMGLKCGYHISPHISSYTERVWIDGKDISREKFAGAFSRIYPYINKVNSLDLGGPITQFEIITALVFMIAREEGIQVMISEAGMGGRWDATNVVHSLAAGLTGVSLEHTEMLGNTISEIAIEKVEVIKENTRASTISNDPEVLDIFKKKTDKIGARCYIYGRDFEIIEKKSMGIKGWRVSIDGVYGRYTGIKLPLIGDYQPLNLSLAVSLAELYMDVKGKKIEPGVLKDAVSDINIKGRFEILKADPAVIADASHNPEGTVKFCHALEEYFGPNKKTIIFAVLADKDYRQMIEKVLNTADILILTSSGSSRSLGAEDLKRETDSIMEKYCDRSMLPGEVCVMDTIENSLNYALKISDSNDIICITGSITNLAHLYRIFKRS
jgi:dihydrofolate synthase / folylpolyglutamate synthase